MLLHSRIFWAQLLVLLLIALIHISALSYNLYWYYVWLDVPVHFLGGLWVALAVLWFLEVSRAKRLARLLPIVFFVLGIGIAWEIFEVVGGISVGEPNYAFDTSIDLLADFIGALLGYALARRFFLPRL